MKISYLNAKEETQVIENIDYLEDDDEWIKMMINARPLVIHKNDVYKRIYTICP